MAAGPPSIAGYEDLVEVGRGGFAVVYRARRPSLDQVVALKVLTGSSFDDRARRRFVREGQAMGALSWHPNIVTVYEAGMTAEGQPFLAMEYLEQGSLGDVVERSGPLDPERAVRHGIELAGALQAVHDRGVLHRDVKPANALLDVWGHALLGDFGIAGLTDGGHTATGQLTATLSHAPPEVLAGQRATTAADVYSLGSTLYELLAGHAAFVRGEETSLAAIVARVATQPPPDLRGRGVPAGAVDVVEWAMAKEPADRPASARALGEALQLVEVTAGSPPTPLRVRPVPPGAGDEPDAGGPASTSASMPPAGSAPPRSGEPTNVVATPGGERPGAPLEAPRPMPSLDAQIRAGAARGGRAPAVPGSHAATAGPGPDPGRRRWPLVAGGVAAVVVVAGLVVALVAGGGGDDGPDGAPVATTVGVGGEPGVVAADDAAVWVTDADRGVVSRLDPTTRELVATVEVGADPVGIALGEGSVWVANREDDTVSRIDPATDEVTATIELGELRDPVGVAVAEGEVWVLGRTGGQQSLVRLATRTEQVGAPIAVADTPNPGCDEVPALALGFDSVWVATAATDLVRLDPQSGTVTAVIASSASTPGSFSCQPVGVLVTEDAVWASNSGSNTVARIDPARDEVLTEVDVGATPIALAALDGSVWVANRSASRVDRIDPASDRVVAEVDVMTRPTGMAPSGDDLWVADQGDGTMSVIDAARVG